MNIQGKTAWITGASSGIGEALAKKLFQKGATVIISARNLKKLEEIKNELDLIEPNRCFVVPCDITRSADIHEAVVKIKCLANKLDLLINNAGVSQRSKALETTLDVDRQLFEVNYFGAVAVTKAIVPWMVKTGGGNVVVLSSMAGKFGFRMRSTYCAAKHALQGFFETLRAELHEKNVKVTLICPGRVKTDISINSLTGHGDKYGIMDAGQAHGVPVDKCAQIIIRAIEKDRKEVFIGSQERFLLVVKRACPSLYYWIVNRVSAT